MSSKTKIVVLHMKEIIYTGIFLVLAIVLAVLLFIMFGKEKQADPTSADVIYHAGVYTSPITLNDNTFDVEVTVDESHINSISLVNLSDITYEEENKYTSLMLLDAIDKALEKARAE